ncbi:MAG: NADH-quinone oxidoreductase subunit M [Rhodanobacteraceae bacterium]
MSTWPLLSLLIWIPVAGAIGVLFCGNARPNAARWLSLGVTLVVLAVSALLLPGFDFASGAMQFGESHSWLPAIHAGYKLGADGISVALILLTTFTTVLVIAGAWEVIKDKVHQFMAAMLVLEGLMIGVFCAMDALLFYVFFEAMLIPMFIIIGIWGGPRRVYATLKFFIYTFLGSIFMLIGLIYLYLKAGTFDLQTLWALPLSMHEQVWLFFAFLIAFAVKIPMVPVHTWLPDAHVEAPTGGSVILAAIMLKMGGYGLLRFSLPMTPDASRELDWLIIALSLIAIIYIAFVALVQQDMKKLVAYSSIAHMGFVTMGAFVVFYIMAATGSTQGAVNGIDGAVVQMISHGLISGALFLCIGVLYDRMHTRDINAYGGVVNVMPVFAAFMVLFALANSGLPGTSGFVGEFLVILASFKASFWLALLAATILIFGAAYNLWLVKRVIFGPVANDRVAGLQDVNGREFLVLAMLALAVLILGVWPAPMLNMMEASVQHLLHQIVVSKIPAAI